MMMLPCCCGCAPAPMPVPRFTNVTTVAGGSPPYKRPQVTCGGTTVCGGVGEPVCYNFNYDGTPFVFSEGIKGVDDCTGGALVSRILDNCYSHDGSTQYEVDTHCGQGWRGVAASKVWQGVPGFIESGAPCCYDGGQLTTKFKTQSMSEIGTLSYKHEELDHCTSPNTTTTLDYTHTVQQTASVDDYGNVTRAGNIHMNSVRFGGYLDSCLVSDCLGELWPDDASLDIVTFPNGLPSVMPAGFPLWAECGIISVGYGLGDPNYAFFPAVQGTAEELNALEINAPAVSASGTLPSGVPWTIVSSGTPASFTLSNNELIVTWESSTITTKYRRGNCTDFPSDIKTVATVTVEYTKTISLGGDEEFSSVIGKANGLLAEWNLADDLQMPWRTDSSCWLLPFVSLDEGGGIPTIDLTQSDCPASARSTVLGIAADCTGCRFTDELGYTGEVRGSPLPNGYGYHFNHFHRVYEVCCPGGIPTATIGGLGELGTSPLPPGATQWTDYATGWDMMGPGGHVSQYGGFSQTPNHGVVVQKWAETLNAWPRENLARPASRDRYLFDETDVACGSVAGTDLTLSSAPTVPFSAGERIAAGSGVYAITGGSGLAYTVGALLYDTPIPCDGASRLRYPSARAIMSTLSATAVQTSPGVITVTASAKHRLKGGGTEFDTVTFTGIGGLTTAVATPTSDTTFTVSGTLTTDPSTGTISDGGSANDSTCSTHSFLYRTFQSNHRAAYDDGEDQNIVTETLLSIAPSSRHPTVLCISPNGESFPNGVTYGFGTIGADMCHGEIWSGQFLQAVPSEYWQAPHHPCGVGGGWSQVALPCDTPGSDEYDFPPLVEPRFGTIDGDTGLYYPNYAYPATSGRPNCSAIPNSHTNASEWYPAWLTCTDWQELIGHRCQ